MATTDLSNVLIESLETHIAQELSSLILDSYRCISVKINYNHGEFDPSNVEMPDEWHCVKYYFKDVGLDIVYSTCGVHLKGDAGRPHIHYHLIVKAYPSQKTFVSNQSEFRRRWRDKESNEGFSFPNTSIRFPDKENPVWQHLSYPLKEGIPIKKGIKGINLEQYNFLKSYGMTRYQVSLGDRARNDASVQRKKVTRDSLFKVCHDGAINFNTYREMTAWLDINYINKLEFDEYPDPKNYKTNCQQIAVKLGKLKYSEIV